MMCLSLKEVSLVTIVSVGLFPGTDAETRKIVTIGDTTDCF